MHGFRRKWGAYIITHALWCFFCSSQPLVTIHFDCIQHSTQQKMWSNYFKHSKGDKFHSCSVRLALAMFLGLRLGLFWLLYVCKREEGYDFTLNGKRSGEMCICLALYVKSGDVINHCCFTLMELVLFIMFAHWKLPVEWLIQKAATGRGMKPLYNSCYFNRSEWKH